MALSFPDNPILGQEAVTGGKTWRWDGSRWQNVGVVGYQGSVGYRGSAGEPGGPQGYSGSQGITGYAGSSGKTQFRQLEDVDITDQANGYIVTYNSNLDKYQVLPISVTDTLISNTVMDGGEF